MRVTLQDWKEAEPQEDFIAHLEQRLGIDRSSAQALLGAWVSHYKPKYCRKSPLGRDHVSAQR